jgi:hypothetical protein
MVGGKVVYGAGPFSRLAPPPPVAQDWLPVGQYGEYYKHPSAAESAEPGARCRSRASSPTDGRREACSVAEEGVLSGTLTR